jgi:hypothetical protein
MTTRRGHEDPLAIPEEMEGVVMSQPESASVHTDAVENDHREHEDNTGEQSGLPIRTQICRTSTVSTIIAVGCRQVFTLSTGRI